MPDGDAIRELSAPPAPPSDYAGLDIDLVTAEGRIAARVQARDDQITVMTNDGQWDVASEYGLGHMLSQLASDDSIRPVVGRRPWAVGPADVILLAMLTARWPELTMADGSIWHPTLAYALPLALDPIWRRWALDSAPRLAGSRQLVVVPATNLVLVEPDQRSAHHHRRLLRRHGSTTSHEHDDLDGFLTGWARFSRWRYGHQVSDVELATLRVIHAMSRSRVRDLVHHGEVIGQSVVCVAGPSGVLFDTMATWRASAAGLRPGILSAVLNLLDALDRGLYYSLGYGQMAYKDEIVGRSRRLELHDVLQ